MITLGIAYPERNKEEPAKSILIDNEVKKLVIAALPIVLLLEEQTQGGEWRRAQIYSKLIKLFPKSDKDDIGFAIEIAVRRMKGKLWP